MYDRFAVVHPLVLLSVTDHHARSVSRNSSKRVVGVLLGQDNGKTVNVANSFGIPFEEDEKDSKTWFLDHNYIEGMYDMFKKVNGTSRPFQSMNRSNTLASPRTDDRMVPHGTQAESIGSRDQRLVQAVYRQTCHGYRRRTIRHRRDTHSCLLRRRRDQRRTRPISSLPRAIHDDASRTAQRRAKRSSTSPPQ